MKAMNQRQARVAGEISHITARAMLGGHLASSFDLTRVTLIEAWVSADLRLARLYVAVPDNWDEEATLLALNHDVAPQVRKVLAREMTTKYTPSVTFAAAGG